MELKTKNVEFRGNFKFKDHLTLIQPLNEAETKYYAATYMSAAPFNSLTYKVNNKDFSCEKGECLITTDNYRTHPSYPFSYHLSFFQGTTLDESKRAFGVLFQDGIGGSLPENSN